MCISRMSVYRWVWRVWSVAAHENSAAMSMSKCNFNDCLAGTLFTLIISSTYQVVKF
jgi:uncharacterized membrane protein